MIPVCHLSVAGTARGGRPFQLQQATQALPELSQANSCLPFTRRRKDDTVVALESHLCQAGSQRQGTWSQRRRQMVPSVPSQQQIANLSFARGGLCRVHSRSRIESFSADLSAGEPPPGLGEIEAANATLRGVSFSPTSYIHYTGQACASPLQNSALFSCFKRSTGTQQSASSKLLRLPGP